MSLSRYSAFQKKKSTYSYVVITDNNANARETKLQNCVWVQTKMWKKLAASPVNVYPCTRNMFNRRQWTLLPQCPMDRWKKPLAWTQIYCNSGGHSFRLLQTPSAVNLGFIGYVNPSPSLLPMGTTRVGQCQTTQQNKRPTWMLTKPPQRIPPHFRFPIPPHTSKPPNIPLGMQLAPFVIPFLLYLSPSPAFPETQTKKTTNVNTSNMWRTIGWPYQSFSSESSKYTKVVWEQTNLNLQIGAIRSRMERSRSIMSRTRRDSTVVRLIEVSRRCPRNIISVKRLKNIALFK